MRPVVFLGPTLDAATARTALDADVRPPARQGDVYRAAAEGAPAVGLVDGLFLDVAPVWHREVLYALSQGVHVFGAGSMGALRAAELDSFGMRGVGAIYAAYRDGRWPGCDDAFEDDDEVAVIHAPARAGWAPLSDAMADLRATLTAAVEAGALSPAAGRSAATEMKRLRYPERSLSRLVSAAPDLAAWLPGNAVARKRLDALEMLEAMADLLRSSPGPHVPSFRFERALVWERFVAAERDAARSRPLERLRRLRRARARAAAGWTPERARTIVSDPDEKEDDR